MSEEPRTSGTTDEPATRSTRGVTPQDRLLLLDMWQRSGLTARDFGALVGITRQSLFASSSVTSSTSIRCTW